jgi:predicted transcriptional regulator
MKGHPTMPKTTTHLTDNEIKVIKAIVESPYGEDLTDETWTMYVAEDAKLTPRTFPGVMSSLVQKGLAETRGDGKEATCNLTDAGAALYKTHAAFRSAQAEG